MKYIVAASLLLVACDKPSDATKTSPQVEREGYLHMNPHKDSELCQDRCKTEYDNCLIAGLNKGSGSEYLWCQRKFGAFDGDDYCLRYGIGREEDTCVQDNRRSCLNRCYNRFNMIVELQKNVGTYQEPTSTSP
jgi:hypothetical protein